MKRIFASPSSRFESPVKRVLDIRNLTRIREYILDLTPSLINIGRIGERWRSRKKGEKRRDRQSDSLDPTSRSFAHDAPVRAALFESSQWWNKTSTGGSNSTRKPRLPATVAPLGLFPRRINPARLACSLARSHALSSYRTLDEQRRTTTFYILYVGARRGSMA